VLCETMRGRLLSIELVSLGISGSAAHSLSKSLMGKGSTLTSINLSCNALGQEGCRMLAQGLEGNGVLKDLDIGANGIGLPGARYLASALEANTTLQNLKLYWNKIGDKGLGSLISGLRENTSLTHLDLRWNGIGSDGMARVRNAMTESKNTTLKSVLLGSPVDSKGYDDYNALAEALGPEDVVPSTESKIVPAMKSPRLCASSSGCAGSSPSFVSRLRSGSAPPKPQPDPWLRETKSDLEVKVLRAQLAEERRRTSQRERRAQELAAKEREIKSLQRRLAAAETSRIHHLNEAEAAVKALDLQSEENASMRRRAVHAEEAAKAHETTIRVLQAKLEGQGTAAISSSLVPPAPPLETTNLLSSVVKNEHTDTDSKDRMLDMSNILEREIIARERAEGLEREVEHWRIKHNREAKTTESLREEIQKLQNRLKLETRARDPTGLQRHRRSMTSAFDLNELMRGAAEQERRWKRRLEQLNFENHVLKIKLKMTATTNDELQPEDHRERSSLMARSDYVEMKNENINLRTELKELQSKNRQMAKVMRYLQAAAGMDAANTTSGT